jgi:hypothetical protein
MLALVLLELRTKVTIFDKGEELSKGVQGKKLRYLKNQLGVLIEA